MVMTGQGTMNVLATMQLTSHLFSNFHANMSLPLVVLLLLRVYISFLLHLEPDPAPLLLELRHTCWRDPGARLLIQVTEAHCVTVKDRSCGTQVPCGANAGRWGCVALWAQSATPVSGVCKVLEAQKPTKTPTW